MAVHIPGSYRRAVNYPKCVKCGSDKVAGIAHGLPTGEAFYDAKVFGDVVFGGCVIRGVRNSWHCKDCSHSWSGSSGNPMPDPKEEREVEEPRVDPVREYYIDRHARRHGVAAPDMGEFEIDCWGVRHRVVVTGNGQLVFRDHEDGIIPYAEDSETSCMKLLGMWRTQRMFDGAPEISRIHRLLRTRAKLRPVSERDDWLLRPISSRIRDEADSATDQAHKILKVWLTENLSEPKENYHLWLVVKSRTLNFVRTAINGRSLKVNIGLHNSRRWLNRVHNKGWAVLGGHFIFEVKEVISEDRMRVLALRETAPFQLAIEEAIVERDGEWRVRFESGS